MKSESKLVRIVPPAPQENGLTPTRGTKVFAGTQEITGVTRIELICDLNDVWRARIDLRIEATDLTSLATFHQPTLWQRVKQWWRFA